MKKLWSLLAGLFVIPFVKADMIIPVLSWVYALAAWGIIPVIIIEVAAAYYLLRKRLGFFYSFLILALANIVSTIAGFFVSFIFPYGGKNLPMIFYLIAVFPAYILSVIIEAPIIHLFIRNKFKKGLGKTFMLSVLVNACSYLPILIFVFVMVFGWLA